MGKELERGAGILLPISSLPSPYGIGTLGAKAYEFVDALRRSGQTYWQVLPAGPTSFGDSPYQSFSAFAGNPYFIDLDILIEEGLLNREEVENTYWGSNPEYIEYDVIYNSRFAILRKAYEASNHKDTIAYKTFLKENESWIEDFGLFMAVFSVFSLSSCSTVSTNHELENSKTVLKVGDSKLSKSDIINSFYT